MSCELCQGGNGITLYQDAKLFVMLVDEPGYPGFCRVIWKDHIKEMTDLSEQDQLYLWQWVMKTEKAIRAVMQPAKINLASLGNVVPHLHWHVIPRFENDAHFPSPIWAVARRDGVLHEPEDLPRLLKEQLA